MIKFNIEHKSKISDARVGILETPHGEVETPTLVSVATQAVVKALDSAQVKDAGTQMLIANTYHLHIRPDEKVVKKAGGIHKFMNWTGPIMTDSGGFQVFSLGFGKDFGTGKILKQKSDINIQENSQPVNLKITDDGVEFRSYVDGTKLFIGPKESIKIQQDIGADIIFAFDECTSPIANKEYTIKSMEKTHRWAKICLESRTSRQAMYGIVQGGKFKDLRIESARIISGLGFNGYGIGGEFGDDKSTMTDMIGCIKTVLPESKPIHLLGIGHLDDLVPIIKSGIDTFDCITPTHYARRGVAFTSSGTLDLKKKYRLFKTDFKPLDPQCNCYVCTTYSRAYLAHLLKSNEITPLGLISFHNIHLFNQRILEIRDLIKQGKF